MDHDRASRPDPAACGDCPLVERRDFLRRAALAVAGIAVALGGSPEALAALPLRAARALGRAGSSLTYPIPAADGAQIDHDNEVILVRYRGKVYAFNLACPHQNTALRWQAEDGIFQCPKHHSRYQPTGQFISGRATRGMDRLGIRRDGANVVVDSDRFYRQDRDAAAWDAAYVPL